MTCGAGRVDHVLRLRQHRAVIGPLPFEPGFEIGRKIGRGEVTGIDLVIRQNFRRRRHAEDTDAGGNCVAQLMQHVGMADQDRGSGILQHIIDFLRLEVPVHRHRIGPEPHRRIGRLDEGDVVAHQDADAVAWLDAELGQSAGHARRRDRRLRRGCAVARPLRMPRKGCCGDIVSCDLSSGLKDQAVIPWRAKHRTRNLEPFPDRAIAHRGSRLRRAPE